MPDFSEGMKKQPKPTGAGGCGGAFAADLGFMAALSMGMSMAIGRLLRGICILDGATTPDPARIKKRQITEKVLHDSSYENASVMIPLFQLDHFFQVASTWMSTYEPKVIWRENIKAANFSHHDIIKLIVALQTVTA